MLKDLKDLTFAFREKYNLAGAEAAEFIKLIEDLHRAMGDLPEGSELDDLTFRKAIEASTSVNVLKALADYQYGYIRHTQK